MGDIDRHRVDHAAVPADQAGPGRGHLGARRPARGPPSARPSGRSRSRQSTGGGRSSSTCRSVAPSSLFGRRLLVETDTSRGAGRHRPARHDRRHRGDRLAHLRRAPGATLGLGQRRRSAVQRWRSVDRSGGCVPRAVRSGRGAAGRPGAVPPRPLRARQPVAGGHTDGDHGVVLHHPAVPHQRVGLLGAGRRGGGCDRDGGELRVDPGRPLVGSPGLPGGARVRRTPRRRRHGRVGRGRRRSARLLVALPRRPRPVRARRRDGRHRRHQRRPHRSRRTRPGHGQRGVPDHPSPGRRARRCVRRGAARRPDQRVGRRVPRASGS